MVAVGRRCRFTGLGEKKIKIKRKVIEAAVLCICPLRVNLGLE
jgi:hypothetical protein